MSLLFSVVDGEFCACVSCMPADYIARPKLLIAFARESMREHESRANPRDRVSSCRNAANRTISREIPTVRVHTVWREILESARDSTW